MHIARGSFVVDSCPDGDPVTVPGATLARRRLDKRFEGDLVGTSTVQMLSATTTVKGSAGYVAIEHVTGTLHGRNGTFVCQHSGVMNRGAPQLVITVVPDSGTGDLTGIADTFRIEIADGRHSYGFEYELAVDSAPCH